MLRHLKIAKGPSLLFLLLASLQLFCQPHGMELERAEVVPGCFALENAGSQQRVNVLSVDRYTMSNDLQAQAAFQVVKLNTGQYLLMDQLGGYLAEENGLVIRSLHRDRDAIWSIFSFVNSADRRESVFFFDPDLRQNLVLDHQLALSAKSKAPIHMRSLPAQHCLKAQQNLHTSELADSLSGKWPIGLMF